MTKAPLVFANFFTNHIAGVLHRFWEDLFPEDVPQKLKRKDLGENKIYIDFAMDVLDKILADVDKYKTKHPELSVAFITSMGLSYHPHDSQNIDAVWEYPEKLMEIFNISKDMYKINLAMHPQKSFKFNSIDVETLFAEKLRQVNIENGHDVFVVSLNGLTVNVTTQINRQLKNEELIINKIAYSLFDVGFIFHQVDKLSSYHVPEGLFLLQESARTNTSLPDVPKVLETNQIKSFLWDRFVREDSRP